MHYETKSNQPEPQFKLQPLWIQCFPHLQVSDSSTHANFITCGCAQRFCVDIWVTSVFCDLLCPVSRLQGDRFKKHDDPIKKNNHIHGVCSSPHPFGTTNTTLLSILSMVFLRLWFSLIYQVKLLQLSKQQCHVNCCMRNS